MCLAILYYVLKENAVKHFTVVYCFKPTVISCFSNKGFRVIDIRLCFLLYLPCKYMEHKDNKNVLKG